MPWKECLVLEERLCFVVRLLDGEAMAGLRREFWPDAAAARALLEQAKTNCV